MLNHYTDLKTIPKPGRTNYDVSEPFTNLMKRLLTFLLCSLVLSSFSTSVSNAQQPVFSDTYSLGTVKEITDERESEVMGEDRSTQAVTVELENGEEVKLLQDYSSYDAIGRKVETGETVVVLRNQEFDSVLYYIADKYRTRWMIGLFISFFALIIFFTGWKGLTSMIGLGFNILMIIYFIIPRIVAGNSPLLICLLGGLVIAVVSLYCAHGLNKRTSVALGSTLITLVIATLLSLIFVHLTMLSGAGTEEAFFLQFGELAKVNLQGLLLGGIIIGALGVLDDVTTAQSAAIDELKKANPKLGFSELYQRGLSIGREHITSLVNTLALAYAGASLPTLLIFSISNQPLWVVINSEYIAEEIIRTLVGSSALILAVPITTAMAAWAFQHQASGATHEGHRH